MDCLFCKIVNGEIPSKKIYEDELVIAILDLYPDVDGHTLIISKKHFDDYKSIDDETILHIEKVKRELSDKLMTKLNAKSMTFSVNYGDRQAIKHFHMHLLPDLGIKPSKTTEEVFEILKKSN